MFNSSDLNKFIKKAGDSLPESAKSVRDEFETNFKALLSAKSEKLNLLSREEFEQRLDQLNHLEQQVSELTQEIETLKKQLDEK